MTNASPGTGRTSVDEPGRLVAALVAIDSTNPTLVPGGAGEARVAEFVAEWLAARGIEVQVDRRDGRPIVLGIRRGSGGGPRLLLNAHTDTVAAGGTTGPFTPRIEGDRLYGRGAYDMKGGLAAAMLALADLPSLTGDVVLAAVPDEEAGEPEFVSCSRWGCTSTRRSFLNRRTNRSPSRTAASSASR